MSELFRLIEDFCAREERKIPWVASKTGIEAKTIYSWKYRPLKKPLAPEDIYAISATIHASFEDVLAASLADSGYDKASAEQSFRKGKSVGRAQRAEQDVDATAPDPEGPEFGA